VATVATIQAIVTESFQLLGVVREGRAPTATQSANGLTILNDNLATQMKDGWGNIGWFPQTVAMLTNLAPLNDADIADIKYLLASWIAARYGITIPNDPNDDLMAPTTLGGHIRASSRRMNKRYLKRTECDLGELSRPQGGPWGGPNFL
jgi:hypothetical protein